MLKVLIVDDMDIVRREIKRLHVWGDRTGFIISAEASNGQAALEILESNPINLVITDIKMPKIDGLELLRKIMEKDLCSCVVLLSDYTDFTYARQGIVLGAFDYMSKPVCEEEFENLLHRAKDFILEKEKEQERIRDLEQKLEEKVEVFFPDADVKQVVQLIEEGNLEYLEVAGRMVDRTEVNLNQDLLKMESVLKNVLYEVTKILFENNKWLKKFIEYNDIKNVNFLQCKDINELREVFMDKIKKIFTLINQLYWGKSGSDLVNQISQCALTSPDDDISLKSIAEKLYMNKTYVSEAFKQKTGVSLIEYLTTIKIERAKKLILEGKFKIYQISDQLGYKDVEYFSKLFKKYTGVPPIEFRQKNLE